MAGGTLANVTTSDDYTGAATLNGPPSERVRVAVYNAAVAYQLQIDAGRWEPEEFLGPWVGTFSQPWVTGIRFRSFAPGQPAQVSARLLPAGTDEGAPPGYTVSPGGIVTPTKALLDVARLSIAAPPIVIGTSTVTAVTLAQAYDFNTNSTIWGARAGVGSGEGVLVGGVYRLTAYVEWAGSGVGVRWGFIRRNGVALGIQDMRGADPDVSKSTLTGLESLAAGDTIEVCVYQDSGGNLNLTNCRLAMEKLT
jgi:hypothetical protein